MDQQNIDRLFREKLDSLEVTPSSETWSQVEKQIQTRKPSVMYWVAASITIILVSWVVWPTQKGQQSEQILADVDHPIQPEIPELVNPVAAALNEKKSGVVNKRVMTPSQTPKVQLVADTDVATMKDVDQKALEEIQMPDPTPKTVVAIEELNEQEIEVNINPVKIESEKPEFRTVKITYIASAPATPSNAGVSKTDSTNVLKKFIAFAEKIDPGEMLADIKTAKDNLINSGFKSKKDKNSMNP